MKSAALLFGLNYAHCASSHLNGCINDVANMAAWLRDVQGIQDCTLWTDDLHLEETSGAGILRQLYQLAVRSYRDDLDFVWIHYSGHGSYVLDALVGGDERDGKDECLVPSDCETKGLIRDDDIEAVLEHFNPKTRVVCIFDCCHSGTIADVRYSWPAGPAAPVVENARCAVKAKVITVSGCMDVQTSADAYNVDGDHKYTGAMTSCLLGALHAKPALAHDVFELVQELRAGLAQRGFSQVPRLCSSHDLRHDRALVPGT